MTYSRLTPSAKPQFWRIQNIKTNERDVAKEWLLAQTKELAIAEGQGFSLAADSERTLCATLTSHKRPTPSNRSWRVDGDFIGFTPLCDPEDANVDIIAVTGLGGHAMGSFAPLMAFRVVTRLCARGHPTSTIRHVWVRHCCCCQ
jgi:hypothetical protein